MRCFLYIVTCCFVSAFNSSQAQWKNGQSARFVIGQPDFTINTPGGGDSGLSVVDDVTIDRENGKLYVADRGNNRVLRFQYPLTGNQPKAELVFGQPNFQSKNTNSTAITASTLNSPRALAVYNGTLWVADASNRRILRFNNAHLISTNGPGADGILGHINFTEKNSSSEVNASSFKSFIYALAIDSTGNLFVADAQNNRVLRFNNAGAKSNGASADGVLGQHTYSTSGRALNEWGMSDPRGLAIGKDNRLYISDTQNNRILRFDSAAYRPDGADADGVLGQVDFETKGHGLLTQAGLQSPMGLAIDASGRLYVSDGGHLRVMIFNNAAIKANGADADYVIGQPDFVTLTGGISADRFYGPVSLTVDGSRGHLLVVDQSNSRILQFNSSSPLPVEEAERDLPLSSQISPNPAKDNLLVKFTLRNDENVKIEIYSSVGEMVLKLSENFEGEKGENTVNISLKELPSGSYSLRISTHDKVLTKQFSIMR